VSFLITPGAEPVAGYRLVERLGGGGCGEVWRADSPGGGQVALKFVPLNSDVANVEQRALECFTAVRHPNIVTGTRSRLELGHSISHRTVDI